MHIVGEKARWPVSIS